MLTIIIISLIIYHNQQYKNRKRSYYFYQYIYNDIDKFELNLNVLLAIFQNKSEIPDNNEEYRNMMHDRHYDSLYFEETKFEEYYKRFKYIHKKWNNDNIYIFEYDNCFDDIYIEEQHNLRIAWDDTFQVVPEECGEILRRTKGFWKDKYYKEPITKNSFPNYLEPPVRIKEMVR